MPVETGTPAGKKFGSITFRQLFRFSAPLDWFITFIAALAAAVAGFGQVSFAHLPCQKLKYLFGVCTCYPVSTAPRARNDLASPNFPRLHIQSIAFPALTQIYLIVGWGDLLEISGNPSADEQRDENLRLFLQTFVATGIVAGTSAWLYTTLFLLTGHRQGMWVLLSAFHTTHAVVYPTLSQRNRHATHPRHPPTFPYILYS